MGRKQLDTEAFKCHVPTGTRAALRPIVRASGYPYGKDSAAFGEWLGAIGRGDLVVISADTYSLIQQLKNKIGK